jgi:hypothetical protein
MLSYSQEFKPAKNAADIVIGVWLVLRHPTERVLSIAELWALQWYGKGKYGTSLW